MDGERWERRGGEREEGAAGQLRRGVLLSEFRSLFLPRRDVMKRIGLTLAVVGMSIGLCGVSVAQNTKSADKSFIKDASEGSLAEVNFAKLALQKSKDPNVRKFAERMIRDHEMLIESMKPFAAEYDVKPSGTPIMDHAKYEELKMKSGTDFDRAYVEAMVKDHHDDLKTFMDEEAKTDDPKLKATVAKGEKVILEHTEMIDNIAHMGGIQTPPIPANA
jgi:putative membrane protein